jgi:hypothetical protein
MAKARGSKKQNRKQGSQGLVSCSIPMTSPAVRSMELIANGDDFLTISLDGTAILLAECLSLRDGCTLMAEAFGWDAAGACEGFIEWRDRRILTASQDDIDYLLAGSEKRLHVAAVLGIDQEMERLIREGWDVNENMVEDLPVSPMAAAVRYCRSPENLRRSVSALLDAGALAEEWMVGFCLAKGANEAAVLIEANLLARAAVLVAKGNRRSACRV